MTESTTNEAPAGVMDAGVIEETTEEGRYIPYGGGSMGWFENSGLLKCELPNNYLFHTVMQSDIVRSKQFERWGEGFNRRGSRSRIRKQIEITVQAGSISVRGSTRDISSNGIRAQFFDEVALEKGDNCKILVHQGESDQVAVEVDAHVVWIERIGKIRQIWNLGVTFLNMTEELNEKFSPFLQK